MFQCLSGVASSVSTCVCECVEADVLGTKQLFSSGSVVESSGGNSIVR